jgi:hypothetical protein
VQKGTESFESRPLRHAVWAAEKVHPHLPEMRETCPHFAIIAIKPDRRERTTYQSLLHIYLRPSRIDHQEYQPLAGNEKRERSPSHNQMRLYRKSELEKLLTIVLT